MIKKLLKFLDKKIMEKGFKEWCPQCFPKENLTKEEVEEILKYIEKN